MSALKCSNCDEEFNYDSELESHEYNTHAVDKCVICHEDIPTPIYKTHLYLQHNICITCQSQITFPHVHTLEKCVICHDVIADSLYKTHLYSQHNTCRVCLNQITIIPHVCTFDPDSTRNYITQLCSSCRKDGDSDLCKICRDCGHRRNCTSTNCCARDTVHPGRPTTTSCNILFKLFTFLDTFKNK